MLTINLSFPCLFYLSNIDISYRCVLLMRLPRCPMKIIRDFVWNHSGDFGYSITLYIPSGECCVLILPCLNICGNSSKHNWLHSCENMGTEIANCLTMLHYQILLNFVWFMTWYLFTWYWKEKYICNEEVLKQVTDVLVIVRYQQSGGSSKSFFKAMFKMPQLSILILL